MPGKDGCHVMVEVVVVVVIEEGTRKRLWFSSCSSGCSGGRSCGNISSGCCCS